MEGFGGGLKDIALTLCGIAFVALLINKSDGTVSVINAGSKAFAGLLGVVTLQNQYGNSFGGYF